MRVAIFTDNDFNKVNGVTTTLRGQPPRNPVGQEEVDRLLLEDPVEKRWHLPFL